jgi:SPP1 gp7 family putative phage head morphogenesis protein
MQFQQQGQAPRNLANEIAYADPFRLFPQKLFYPYNPSALIGKKGYRIIDQMRKDEQVKASILFKSSAVAAAGWTVESPPQQAEDWEVSLFVKKTLTELQGTLESTIADLMRDGMIYGHAIAEKIFDKELHLIQLKLIRPHEIHYQQDEFGNLIQLQQERPEGRIPLEPIEKFVLWNYEGYHQNLYGESDLEAAYRAWWSKKNVYNWLGMLLERFGIPPVFLFYNPDAFKGNTLTELQTVMQNIQASTYALIPRKGGAENLEPWTPELAAKVNDVFLPALDRYDQDIAKALLMPQMVGLTPETQAGSYARSKVAFDVFMLVLDRLRQETEESIMNEQVIRPLVDLHFNVSEYPKFKLNPITDDQRMELLASWSQLITARAVRASRNDAKHIRSLLDFPEPDEDEQEVEPPEKNSQAQPENQPQGKLPTTPKPSAPQQKTELTQYTAEQRLDVAKTKAELDNFELTMAAQLNEVLSARLNMINTRLKSQGAQSALDSIANGNLISNQAQQIILDGLTAILRAGRRSLFDELEGVSVEHVSFNPFGILKDAVEFLQQKALRLAATINSGALAAIRDSLLSSLGLGETPREAEGRLKEAVKPFVAEGKVDSAQLIPARIESVVRTETTNAYNMGRVLGAHSPAMDKILSGWRYSAILDSRTTEICRYLNGRFIPKGDPSLYQLAPPNHVNCRSILVPVTIIDAHPDPITPSQKGKAQELAQQGFM